MEASPCRDVRFFLVLTIACYVKTRAVAKSNGPFYMAKAKGYQKLITFSKVPTPIQAGCRSL
jgi:hypothetical protein